jgi:phosphomannomutase
MAAMLDAPTPIATHAGLRGRPGRELSDELVAATIRRFASLLRAREVRPSVALARDERPEGRRLAALVAHVALAAGVDVVDLEVSSAPAAKHLARTRELGGSVIVTGSHLDRSWNGLKLAAAPTYWPVDVRELPADDADGATVRRRGRMRRDGAAARLHAASVGDAGDAEAIGGAGLRVSCVGGAGGSGPALLERLGCRPSVAGADAMLRLDADGDRLALADERGRELDSELTLALGAIARRARSVVAGADTSRAIEAVVSGPVHRVPPGELHLLRGLAAHGGDLAGEGNGGVVLPEVGPARDGLAAAALVLDLIATSRRPLSELAADVPRLARRRAAIPCGEDEARAQVAAVAERWATAPVDAEAGVVVERGGAWALVRPSATEAVLRITTEAPGEAEADALHGELLACLEVSAG